MNLIFRLWGTPVVNMFATVHNVHLPSSGASSTSSRCTVTGLAGEVDVHVSTVSPAQQSHSEAQDHPRGRGDTNSSLVAVTTWFPHLLHLCVDYPRFFPNCRDLLSHRDMSRATSRTICMHGGSHATLPSSRIFEKRSLNSQQLLEE